MAAAAFMIVRDSYTTIAYFLHERARTRITWRPEPHNENCYLALFCLV